jgi:hypothetical protein
VVGFKKLDRDGNEVEEQTPIHIKDIEKMTHDSNHSDQIVYSIRSEKRLKKKQKQQKQRMMMIVKYTKHNSKISSTDKTKNRSKTKL